MPGYDDITGGVPPGAVDPFALPYPPPHWLPDAAPAPLAAGAMGPLPEGAAPPPAPPDPALFAAPPPVTDQALPAGAGVPEVAPITAPDLPAPPLPAGESPPPFGPSAPTARDLLAAPGPLAATYTQEALATPPEPFTYSVGQRDASLPLPSGQETVVKGPWDNLSDQEARAKAERLSPWDLAELDRSQAAAARAKANYDLARADEENTRQLKQNLEDRKVAEAQAMAHNQKIVDDAVALSKRPLDRRRWFNSESTFQKVMTGIAAIAGGLMSKPGGPNLGVEYLQKKIDDDINDQKAEIENERTGLQARQGLVAEEFKRSGNLFEAAEKVRLATYAAVINKLQTAQQDLDPRGSQFADHARQVQAMQSAMVSQIDKNGKDLFEAKLKANTDTRAERELQLKEREAALKEQAAKAKGAGGVGAGKVVLTPAQLAERHPDTPVPPVAMSDDDYGKWLARQKTGAELLKSQEEVKRAARENDPATLAREQQVPGIVDTEGKPISFLPDEVKQLKKAKYIATELTRKSNELRALVEEHGYDPGWTKSTYYQQAQQLYAAMLLMDKDLKSLGALSESDIKLEQANLGTDSPTQLRSTMAGMDAYYRDVVEGMNALIGNTAVGVKPKRWEPVNTAKLPKSGETVKEAQWKELTRKAGESFEDVAREEISKRRAELSSEQLADPAVAAAATREGLAAARQSYMPDVSRKQQAAVRDLAQAALGPPDDPAAQEARNRLDDLAQKADTAALRKLAAQALRDAADAAALATQEATGGPTGRSVVHETVPPRRGGK